MSRRNAPNQSGGFMSGVFGGLTGAGTSETEPPGTPPGKNGGHAGGAGRNSTGPKWRGAGNTNTAGKNPIEPPEEKGNGNASASAPAPASTPASAPAAATSRTPAELPAVPGLAEFVDILRAMAAAPLGARPKLDQELIDRIQNSPLGPVLHELQPIYKKLGPLEGSPEHLQAQAQAQAAQRAEAHQPTSQPESAPGPGPSSGRTQPPQSAPTPASGASSVQHPPPTLAALDVAELKSMEATLRSLSTKLDLVSQTVTDVTTRGEMSGNFRTLDNSLRQADSETRDAVKASGDAAKTQIETVDKKVTQMTDKLDPALAELKQGVKRLQVGLLDDVQAQRTRLETKVKELEKENKELQQVIHDTNVELLPVEVVTKIALEGTFTDGPETGKSGTGKPGSGKPGARAGADNATPSLQQTAQKIRINTLSLVDKCRALFTFIRRDPDTESDISDLGKDGEWGRCAEHLRASHSKLRNAIEEKEGSDQRLQFVGFVIEQIRKGHYTEKEWESDTNWKSFVALVEKSPDGFKSIQLLAEDLSQLVAQAAAPPVPNDPTSSTDSADSNTSTAKPADESSQAPAVPAESVVPLTSTPAVTAPSSPVVRTKPVPSKKDRDVRPPTTKRPSQSIRIKMVFNPNPGPLYGWGPLVSPKRPAS